ncbi:MAG: ribonuclease HII, partial [Oscillospiraceae bacterium]
MDLFEYDSTLQINTLCGVDEAGRGPLAGDVYAAAVILPKNVIIEGLNDSKKLTEKKREILFDKITEVAISYCVATASVEEIEKNNILNATFLAMRRAVQGLKVSPDLVIIDGNRNPDIGFASKLLVKGDATSACVAAASILAKVSRDRYMKELDKLFPEYQFEKHKGYGTKLHYEMLDKYGASPVHRLSFLKKYFKNEPTKSKLTGDFAENFVCEYLLAQGATIVKKQYHSAYGEVDIIAMQKEYLLFIEVKARKENEFAQPCEAVTKSKQ